MPFSLQCWTTRETTFPQHPGLSYAACNQNDVSYVLQDSKRVTEGILQEIS